MAFRQMWALLLLAGVLLTNNGLISAQSPASTLDLSAASDPGTQDQATKVRRVNASYKESGEEAAIFWFGRVTPTENYVDVRVGYQDEYLFVHVAVFDRLLWYDESPSPGDLTSWDSATLYVNTEGNVGSVPGAGAYRFDAQLNWWEARDGYQASYAGDGNGWTAASVPFSTTSFWAGSVPNDEANDRGWAVIFYIPYESLGVSDTPVQGTGWGLAVTVHDRDDAAGTPIDDEKWPETMVHLQPETWGQMAFGWPSYALPGAVAEETIEIRHGLNGAVVPDANVGGGTDCGDPAKADDYFPTWGELNYAGEPFLNIQNLGIIGDWPCVSKYYVTFPLDSLPSDKTVVSATLTLHQTGNAGEGEDPGPLPSLIQVLTVDEDWDEATITWNNAPRAVQNVSATWAYPFETPPEWPGVAREWDVSLAVAEAYAEGVPLRLALYEADWAFHAGKYFPTSDIDEWGQEARPTLTVSLGSSVASLEKAANRTSGHLNDAIAYSVGFVGTGQTLTLTDSLSAGVSEPGDFVLSGTSTPPSYDGTQHRLTWSGSPAPGEEVTVGYVVTITTGIPTALVNTAELYEPGEGTSTVQSVVVANPSQVYLPQIFRSSPGQAEMR